MAEPAMRVALLARPGAACERLQAALQEAGAQLVLVADPTQGAAVDVAAAGAQAVLVALEPSVEEALDRYEALLADPAVTVIFDEAELAAQRDGWDAARWVRHLAAKLHRHGDVLPPGAEAVAEDVDLQPQPGGLSLYRRPESDGDLSAIAGEAETLAVAVPRDQLDSTAAAPDRAGPAAAPAPPLDLGEPADDHLARDRFQRDLDELQQRIAGMELVDAPRPRVNRDGAVLVLAGIGGPDAVRQLLGSLPEGFPRPVLIQQRLDGARHDKLVRQMQRATAMPVHLAVAGEALQRGHVYVLPAELGLIADDAGLRFGDAGADLLAQLPAADSAVILLSGSDPAVVDAAMTHAARGALVAGQSPDGCYDAVAAQALAARGAEAGAPAELARKLAARWPA
ncbi:chemotaxis protein CheB [Cognatiluteimonas weifangensis]|nr:chemotaxis protein CheB [Luteimonas weifangensis]